MLRQIRFVAAAALMLALQAGALAQTTSSATSAAQDVQRLAPQLVTFAGSDANFQNLVNGLSQGVSVTLTTITADGFLQTVTFTPAGPLPRARSPHTPAAGPPSLTARGLADPAPD